MIAIRKQWYLPEKVGAIFMFKENDDEGWSNKKEERVYRGSEFGGESRKSFDKGKGTG